jgi:hypothetical protein
MNKTQRFTLAGFCVSVLALASLFAGAITVPNGGGLFLRRFFLLLAIVVSVCAIFFLLRKQSSAEPAFDERDVLIKQKAVAYSFVALWLTLITACVLSIFALGADGRVTVGIFPLCLLVIFGIVSIVYFMSILVQYGWKEKSNE